MPNVRFQSHVAAWGRACATHDRQSAPGALTVLNLTTVYVPHGVGVATLATVRTGPVAASQPANVQTGAQRLPPFRRRGRTHAVSCLPVTGFLGRYSDEGRSEGCCSHSVLLGSQLTPLCYYRCRNWWPQYLNERLHGGRKVTPKFHRRLRPLGNVPP